MVQVPKAQVDEEEGKTLLKQGKQGHHRALGEARKEQLHQGLPARGRATSRNYNTGPGSLYYMAFGDDSSHQAAQVELPYLNQEAVEIDTTQTAPPEAS
jgi:hypothetical protein